MDREPALIIGALVALLNLLVAFGVALTQEQSAAIVAFAQAALAVFLALGGAALVRRFVTPVGKSQE